MGERFIRIIYFRASLFFFRSHLSDFCLPLTTLKDHIGQDIFTAGVISSIKNYYQEK